MRACAPCVSAREFVFACGRAELFEADFSTNSSRILVVLLIELSCGEMATAPPHKLLADTRVSRNS